MILNLHTLVSFILFLIFMSPNLIYVNALEYCQSESFTPVCQSDEVIWITSAFYGRMKFGRCVVEEQQLKALWSDKQYLGCSADVLQLMSKKCTGKKECSLKVPDPELEKTSPCYSSLKMYLDVSYSCIKVAQNNRQCSISLTTDNQIYVLSPQKKELCGTKQQPWIVEVMKGQKIVVSMLSTETDNKKGDKNKNSLNGQTRFCQTDQIVGFIAEKTNKHKFNSTVCRSPSTSIVFESAANNIEITFAEVLTYESKVSFLKLEATGCSDLIPPADAWLKRTENEAIIGCYSTRLRWQLKCQGQRWIGVIGNCSYVHDNIPSSVKSEKAEPADNLVAENNSQVFTITIICAIGIVLCSFIVCIGIVCLKKYSQKSKLVESMLNEKQILSNGSMLRPVGYQPYQNHQLENKQMENGNCDNDQGQYFILDENLTAPKEDERI